MKKFLMVILTVFSLFTISNIKIDASTNKSSQEIKTSWINKLKSNGFSFYLSDSKRDYPYCFIKNTPKKSIHSKLKFYNPNYVKNVIKKNTRFKITNILNHGNSLMYKISNKNKSIQGWTDFNNIRNIYSNNKALKPIVNAEINYLDGKKISTKYLYNLTSKLSSNNTKIAIKSIKETKKFKRTGSFSDIPSLLAGLV